MPQPLFQNQCFFFCCLLSSTLKSEPTKRYTNIVSITTRDDLQRYIVSYFYKSHRALLLSRNLIKFLKNFVEFSVFSNKAVPYSTIVEWEKFSSLWCSDYCKMHLWVKKVCIFTHTSKQNLPSPPSAFSKSFFPTERRRNETMKAVQWNSYILRSHFSSQEIY